MRKILSAFILALVLMFTACNGVQTKDVDNQDSINVVVDTATEITDTVFMVAPDTIHCVAITRTGERCKNHRVNGDSLCARHRNIK